jgi:hypothetical protein
MELKVIGTVKELLAEQSGESRNGPWRKQEFILETTGNYPKSICMVMWGDSIDQFGVQVGETITAHIDLSSREYNGRWYTDVKAWKVERDQERAGGPPKIGADEPFPEPPAFDDSEDDGLPF